MLTEKELCAPFVMNLDITTNKLALKKEPSLPEIYSRKKYLEDKEDDYIFLQKKFYPIYISIN
jgi:hypothetical protein